MKRLSIIAILAVLAVVATGCSGLVPDGVQSFFERKASADTVGSVSIKATVVSEPVIVFGQKVAELDGKPMLDASGDYIYEEDRSHEMYLFAVVASEKDDGEDAPGEGLTVLCDPDNVPEGHFETCGKLHVGSKLQNLSGVLALRDNPKLFATRVKLD